MRKMRRFKQLLDNERCKEILNRNTSGVLALLGDDGYPYSVPLSYHLINNQLVFHGAKNGHKIDAMKNYDKASFCVIDQDQIVPEKYTTYFRSVICFGKMEIIEDDTLKKELVSKLAGKYRPDFIEERDKEIDREFRQLCVFVLNIDQMTGKEAIELVNQAK